MEEVKEKLKIVMVVSFLIGAFCGTFATLFSLWQGGMLTF